jgi:hypothetical protein
VYRSPLFPGHVIKELQVNGYLDRRRFLDSSRETAIAIGYGEPVLDLSPKREDFKIVLQKDYRDCGLESLIRDCCAHNDHSQLEFLISLFIRQSTLLWSVGLMDFDAKFSNFVFGGDIRAPRSIDIDLIGRSTMVGRTDFFRFTKNFFAHNLSVLGSHRPLFLQQIEKIPHLSAYGAIPWGPALCDALLDVPVDLWDNELLPSVRSMLASIYEKIGKGWAHEVS